MAVLDYTSIMLIHASFNISPKSTLTALSLTIPCVLDKSEVIAKPIEQPRFLPWEFDTDSKFITGYYWGVVVLLVKCSSLSVILNLFELN